MDYRTISVKRSEGKAIVGDFVEHKVLPDNFYALFAANTVENTASLSTRSLGELISSRGSFNFEKDPTPEWLQKSGLTTGIHKTDALALEQTRKRLGTIQIDAYALFYTDNQLISFWIETHEAEKTRVFASEINGNGDFETLPEDFRFEPVWLAKSIIAQY